MTVAIAALCTDLFFGSRIAEVARTLGVPCQIARDLDALLEHARTTSPALIIVDMVLRGGADTALAVRTLRADPATQAARLVAFLPHTHEELAQAAAAAGAELVLTRGQLTKQLPGLVAALT